MSLFYTAVTYEYFVYGIGLYGAICHRRNKIRLNNAILGL